MPQHASAHAIEDRRTAFTKYLARIKRVTEKNVRTLALLYISQVSGTMYDGTIITAA